LISIKVSRNIIQSLAMAGSCMHAYGTPVRGLHVERALVKKSRKSGLIAAMDDPCDCFLARWTNCRTAFTGNGGEIKTAKFQV
jgi:hypothetical protein